MEKYILALVIIFVFCVLYIRYRIKKDHRNFYNAIMDGKIGMRCKYWIEGYPYYGRVQFFDKKTGNVTVTGFHGMVKIPLGLIQPAKC